MAMKAKNESLDPTVLLGTDQGHSKLEYQAGEVFFSQGDEADSVFHIVRGKVKVAVISDQGREAIVGLLADGDFFGEGCLTGQPLRLATAVAITDVSVIRIEKAEMIRILHTEPDFAQVFIKHLLNRNSRIEADLCVAAKARRSDSVRAQRSRMSSFPRFLTCWVESGEWFVMDQTRDDIVMHLRDGKEAELIAALMNGDLAKLATANPETLANCYKTVRRLLHVPRERHRPEVASEAFSLH
jgi:hypothetical protein